MWKRIENYPDYEINEDSQIMSYKRKPKLLVQFPKRDGYLRVSLLNNGEMIQASVHRLVAEAFIPNPDNKPFVNHKDLNKQNNHVDNLEWVTGRENVTHYYVNSTDKSIPTGVYKHGNCYSVLVRGSYEGAHLGSFSTPEEAKRVYEYGANLLDTKGMEALLEYKHSLYGRNITSKYQGVSYNSVEKRRQKWTASLFHNGVKVLSKRFKTEEEAVEAVIAKCIEVGRPLHFSHINYLNSTIH